MPWVFRAYYVGFLNTSVFCLCVCVCLRSACVCLVYGNVWVGVCSVEVGRTSGVSPHLRTYLRQALLFPNLRKPGWQDTDLYKHWNHRHTSLSPSLQGFWGCELRSPHLEASDFYLLSHLPSLPAGFFLRWLLRGMKKTYVLLEAVIWMSLVSKVKYPSPNLYLYQYN